jgi:aminoglycoside phosphotransferase (APT) family kinase protein
MIGPPDTARVCPVSDSETTDIRAAIDVERLTQYLTVNLPGFREPLTVRQFKGGQSNPTYLLTTGAGKYVLRKKPGGQLLHGAHMIEREYKVMRALKGSGVPVANVPLLCEDSAVIGTPFYVMDFLEGRIFRDPAVPEVDAAERAQIYAAMSDTLAKLHAVDWQAVGLSDFGKPTGYLGRQITLWSRQYAAGKTHDIPEMDRLIAWLPDNIPANEITTISHGDFRLENLMIAPDRPEVLATLDWELATLGHPFADLAYNCMIWHLPHDTPNVPGLAGRPLPPGLPSEADYIAGYCKAAGLSEIPQYDFYLAFSFFRFAAIAQGIYARWKGGNASAPNAEQVGLLARPLSELGWAAAGRLG